MKIFYFLYKLSIRHNDSVRCLQYNPTSYQLLSCTNSDFGLWSPEQKNVNKIKVSSQINCCCWNENGIIFALGYNSGVISLRFKVFLYQLNEIWLKFLTDIFCWRMARKKWRLPENVPFGVFYFWNRMKEKNWLPLIGQKCLAVMIWMVTRSVHFCPYSEY